MFVEQARRISNSNISSVPSNSSSSQQQQQQQQHPKSKIAYYVEQQHHPSSESADPSSENFGKPPTKSITAESLVRSQQPPRLQSSEANRLLAHSAPVSYLVDTSTNRALTDEDQQQQHHQQEEHQESNNNNNTGGPKVITSHTKSNSPNMKKLPQDIPSAMKKQMFDIPLQKTHQGHRSLRRPLEGSPQRTLLVDVPGVLERFSHAELSHGDLDKHGADNGLTLETFFESPHAIREKDRRHRTIDEVINEKTYHVSTAMERANRAEELIPESQKQRNVINGKCYSDLVSSVGAILNAKKRKQEAKSLGIKYRDTMKRSSSKLFSDTSSSSSSSSSSGDSSSSGYSDEEETKEKDVEDEEEKEKKRKKKHKKNKRKRKNRHESRLNDILDLVDSVANYGETRASYNMSGSIDDFGDTVDDFFIETDEDEDETTNAGELPGMGETDETMGEEGEEHEGEGEEGEGEHGKHSHKITGVTGSLKFAKKMKQLQQQQQSKEDSDQQQQQQQHQYLTPEQQAIEAKRHAEKLKREKQRQEMERLRMMRQMLSEKRNERDVERKEASKSAWFKKAINKKKGSGSGGGIGGGSGERLSVHPTRTQATMSSTMMQRMFDVDFADEDEEAEKQIGIGEDAISDFGASIRTKEGVGSRPGSAASSTTNSPRTSRPPTSQASPSSRGGGDRDREREQQEKEQARWELAEQAANFAKAILKSDESETAKVRPSGESSKRNILGQPTEGESEITDLNEEDEEDFFASGGENRPGRINRSASIQGGGMNESQKLEWRQLDKWPEIFLVQEKPLPHEAVVEVFITNRGSHSQWLLADFTKCDGMEFKPTSASADVGGSKYLVYMQPGKKAHVMTMKRLDGMHDQCKKWIDLMGVSTEEALLIRSTLTKMKEEADKAELKRKISGRLSSSKERENEIDITNVSAGNALLNNLGSDQISKFLKDRNIEKRRKDEEASHRRHSATHQRQQQAAAATAGAPPAMKDRLRDPTTGAPLVVDRDLEAVMADALEKNANIDASTLLLAMDRLKQKREFVSDQQGGGDENAFSSSDRRKSRVGVDTSPTSPGSKTKRKSVATTFESSDIFSGNEEDVQAATKALLKSMRSIEKSKRENERKEKVEKKKKEEEESKKTKQQEATQKQLKQLANYKQKLEHDREFGFSGMNLMSKSGEGSLARFVDKNSSMVGATGGTTKKKRDKKKRDAIIAGEKETKKKQEQEAAAAGSKDSTDDSLTNTARSTTKREDSPFVRAELTPQERADLLLESQEAALSRRSGSSNSSITSGHNLLPAPSLEIAPAGKKKKSPFDSKDIDPIAAQALQGIQSVVMNGDGEYNDEDHPLLHDPSILKKRREDQQSILHAAPPSGSGSRVSSAGAVSSDGSFGSSTKPQVLTRGSISKRKTPSSESSSVSGGNEQQQQEQVEQQEGEDVDLEATAKAFDDESEKLKREGSSLNLRKSGSKKFEKTKTTGGAGDVLKESIKHSEEEKQQQIEEDIKSGIASRILGAATEQQQEKTPEQQQKQKQEEEEKEKPSILDGSVSINDILNKLIPPETSTTTTTADGADAEKAEQPPPADFVKDPLASDRILTEAFETAVQQYAEKEKERHRDRSALGVLSRDSASPRTPKGVGSGMFRTSSSSASPSPGSVSPHFPSSPRATSLKELKESGSPFSSVLDMLEKSTQRQKELQQQQQEREKLPEQQQDQEEEESAGGLFRSSSLNNISRKSATIGGKVLYPLPPSASTTTTKEFSFATSSTKKYRAPNRPPVENVQDVRRSYQKKVRDSILSSEVGGDKKNVEQQQDQRDEEGEEDEYIMMMDEDGNEIAVSKQELMEAAEEQEEEEEIRKKQEESDKNRPGTAEAIRDLVHDHVELTFALRNELSQLSRMLKQSHVSSSDVATLRKAIVTAAWRYQHGREINLRKLILLLERKTSHRKWLPFLINENVCGDDDDDRRNAAYVNKNSTRMYGAWRLPRDRVFTGTMHAVTMLMMTGAPFSSHSLSHSTDVPSIPSNNSLPEDFQLLPGATRMTVGPRPPQNTSRKDSKFSRTFEHQHQIIKPSETPLQLPTESAFDTTAGGGKRRRHTVEPSRFKGVLVLDTNSSAYAHMMNSNNNNKTNMDLPNSQKNAATSRVSLTVSALVK